MTLPYDELVNKYKPAFNSDKWFHDHLKEFYTDLKDSGYCGYLSGERGVILNMKETVSIYELLIALVRGNVI